MYHLCYDYTRVLLFADRDETVNASLWPDTRAGDSGFLIFFPRNMLNYEKLQESPAISLAISLLCIGSNSTTKRARGRFSCCPLCIILNGVSCCSRLDRITYAPWYNNLSISCTYWQSLGEGQTVRLWSRCMELIIFLMKPRFQKLVNSGLPMRWIKYGRSMLVLGSSCITCRPSSSDIILLTYVHNTSFVHTQRRLILILTTDKQFWM